MNNARKRAKTLKGSEKCTESNDIRLKCNVQHAPNGGAAAGAWDGGCKRGGSRALALGGSGSMSVGGGARRRPGGFCAVFPLVFLFIFDWESCVEMRFKFSSVSKPRSVFELPLKLI